LLHYSGSVDAFDAIDCAKRRRITLTDALWLILREEFIPSITLHEFACLCARDALDLVGGVGPISEGAIEIKLAWLRGEATDDELKAIREAVDEEDIVCDEGCDFFKISAKNAAKDAIWAATGTSARDAVWDAAANAAWAAIRFSTQNHHGAIRMEQLLQIEQLLFDALYGEIMGK